MYNVKQSFSMGSLPWVVKVTVVIGLCLTLFVISACSTGNNNNTFDPVTNEDNNEQTETNEKEPDEEEHGRQNDNNNNHDGYSERVDGVGSDEVDVDTENEENDLAGNETNNENPGHNDADNNRNGSKDTVDSNEADHNNTVGSNVADSNTTTDGNSKDIAGESNSNAANNPPKSPDPQFDENEERILTVGFLYDRSNDNNKFMRERYTKWFEWDHPSVEVDFVTASELIEPFSVQDIDTAEEMRRLMDRNDPPDVVLLSYEDYLELMGDGYLVALDPFMKNSELDREDYVSILMEALANPTDDLVYGLAPSLKSSALVYNKDLFDELRIGYPQDHMTWDEVFTLAKQVSSAEDDTFGLLFDPYNYRPPSSQYIMEWYAPGLGLSVLDESKNQVVVDSDDWRNVIRTFKDLHDAGVFPEESYLENIPLSPRNTFLVGNVAMATMDYDEIRHFMKDIEGYREPFAWDIVTIPVHPGARSVGANVWMDPIIAINANGRNQQDAWALIESIHSEDWASQRGDTMGGNLSSLKNYTSIYESELDYNKEALYQLRPAQNNLYFWVYLNGYAVRSWEQGIAGRMPIQQVFSGEMTIDEAIDSWEADGYFQLAQRDGVEYYW